MQTKKTELDYYFQVLLIGDSSYERNQFLEYILKNRKKKEEDILTDNYLTIIDYYDEKKLVKLTIWNINDINTELDGKIDEINGIILLFDETEKKTLDEIIKLYRIIKQKLKRKVPIKVLGNNCYSYCIEIDKSKLKQFIKNEGLNFCEIDTPNGCDIFYSICKLVSAMTKAEEDKKNKCLK